jgi:hypothetical protein
MECSGANCNKLVDNERYKTCKDCRARALARYHRLHPGAKYHGGALRVSEKCYKTPTKFSKEIGIPRYEKLKARLYAGYGNYCACCGETNCMFFTIDHVYNNGAEDRRLNGKAQGSFYYRLIREGFPKEYQILCANCNLGKHRNRGVCPHKG